MKFLPDFAHGASGLVAFPVQGLLLIAMVWFLPRGLAGLFGPRGPRGPRDSGGAAVAQRPAQSR